MTPQQQPTVTVPGVTVAIREPAEPVRVVAAAVTETRAATPLDVQQRFLSDKPLRRPNRARPLDE